MKMKKLDYRLTFTTPAFLGDAQQNARWRTPPIKAQLRQWWRVAYAAEHGFRVTLSDMRREEGLLFGNAWLEGEFRKSLVRLRLSRWDEGKLKKAQWPADSTVSHPEVNSRQGSPVPVGSMLYLGYGPLLYDNQGRTTTLKANAAIQAGEAAALAIVWPTTHEKEDMRQLMEANLPRLEQALWLMDRYGTLGGRSRNGWGSYALSPLPRGEGLGVRAPLRDWRQCLDRDWPHAIGKDEKGALIWQTAEHDDWKTLMRTLAIIKIGLRTQFKFTTGRRASSPEHRHWLSYPVTNHDVAAWNALRLPNQLRFKVRRTDAGKLAGVIFHMPHLPPDVFSPNPNRSAIEEVWRCVHQFLDALTKQGADKKALAKQAPQLDGVRLERIAE